jgi:hypothetical protein
MKRRISAVGFVLVSLKRSITLAAMRTSHWKKRGATSRQGARHFAGFLCGAPP